MYGKEITGCMIFLIIWPWVGNSCVWYNNKIWQHKGLLCNFGKSSFNHSAIFFVDCGANCWLVHKTHTLFHLPSIIFSHLRCGSAVLAGYVWAKRRNESFLWWPLSATIICRSIRVLRSRGYSSWQRMLKELKRWLFSHDSTQFMMYSRTPGNIYR